MVPKQVGQSGQAKLEPVAWTMLPRRRSARVHSTVAWRSRWDMGPVGSFVGFLD
jgi:hypothetical protein